MSVLDPSNYKVLHKSYKELHSSQIQLGPFPVMEETQNLLRAWLYMKRIGNVHFKFTSVIGNEKVNCIFRYN